jgi:hypothetical protein
MKVSNMAAFETRFLGIFFPFGCWEMSVQYPVAIFKAAKQPNHSPRTYRFYIYIHSQDENTKKKFEDELPEVSCFLPRQSYMFPSHYNFLFSSIPQLK